MPTGTGTMTPAFESLDGASVLRLTSVRGGGGTGLSLPGTRNVAGQGLDFEIRLNTLVQGTGASTDEFIALSLSAVDDPNRSLYVNLFSDANGANRQFRSARSDLGRLDQAFAFADNTWYRLKLEAAANGNVRAVVLSDASTELLSRDLGVTADWFTGGARFGIYQFNTLGGTATKADVAIDWARLDTTPAAPAPLVLDALTSGERTVATQRDLYSFTLAQDTLVVMDPRVDNGQLRWTLTGDRGQIGSLNFQQRSWDMGGNPVMRLAAGTYTLRIDGNTTGAYGFRLMDLSAATVLTPGTPLSDTLAPGNSTRAYRFDAAAGDRVYFDAQQASNGDSSWRLISPSGDQRWITGLTSDVDVTTLDQAGTWTLVVEGRRYQAAATNAFRINAQPVADIEATLVVGERVDGTIAHTGQRLHYEFTLGTRAAMLFDALSDSPFNWSLRGPRGTLVGPGGFLGGERAIRSSDSWDIGGNPLLDLEAGNYVLTVDGAADATGNVAFRLLDLAAATPITPGWPAAGR
ncbi:hypothetical protein [Ramlibacter montanisoli]|uniref:SO2946-like C-terminal domain-containing protein n=1 Tax=Ramlibacter montanisoli TaxID=2732512 RepID=A0A849KBC7_9BURK|nr:hypothetical protein [Ramlibacter montanisoli]NNU43754.1 hypothetical protein [Ramlibacter montanisoli]